MSATPLLTALASSTLQHSDADMGGTRRSHLGRRHQLTLTTGLATVGLLLMTALIAWVPVLQDAGTPRTWWFPLLAAATLVQTIVMTRREHQLDARRGGYVVGVLLAAGSGVTGAVLARHLITAGLSARNTVTAMTGAVLAAVLLLVATISCTGEVLEIPSEVRGPHSPHGRRAGVLALTASLVAAACGTIAEHVTLDSSTAPGASDRATTLPVKGRAWHRLITAHSYNAVSTPVGLALLTDGRLQLLDGRTGRELWHRERRFVSGYRDDYLSGSPDGRHLAMAEKTWPTEKTSVSLLTVLTDRGQVLQQQLGVDSEALTNNIIVGVEAHRIIARDWSGRQVWQRDRTDDCSTVYPLTTTTVLLAEGCQTVTLTQLDEQGHTLTQFTRREWDDVDIRTAPDGSSAQVHEGFVPSVPGASSEFEPNLMFDSHGQRDLSACSDTPDNFEATCEPGENGSLWVTTFGQHHTTTVVDAHGNRVQQFALSHNCSIRPILGGSARTCYPGRTVTLTASPPVTVQEDPEGYRQLFPAGGAWVSLVPTRQGLELDGLV